MTSLFSTLELIVYDMYCNLQEWAWLIVFELYCSVLGVSSPGLGLRWGWGCDVPTVYEMMNVA